jgi:hypothetical protein
MVGSGYRSESAGDQQTVLDDGEGENEDLLGSNDSEGADNKAGLEVRDFVRVSGKRFCKIWYIFIDLNYDGFGYGDDDGGCE